MTIFNVPIFFVILRESIEASLVISVMLAFTTRLGITDPLEMRKLRRQILFGSLAAFILCVVIGGVLIYLFYRYSSDIWSKHEDLWEGIFSLISSVVMGIVGYYFLQLQKLTFKIEAKLKNSMTLEGTINKKEGFFSKYSFAILAFLTIIREGVEAILLISGVAINATAKSVPLSVVVGITVGLSLGVLLYFFNNRLGMHAFLVASTIFLYVMGAAMFTNSIKFLESYTFGRSTNFDADAGYVFQISKSVWMLNCCNPSNNDSGGYQIFQALLGWTNNATVGTILGYLSYWFVVTAFYIYKGLQTKKALRVKMANNTNVELQFR
ncbi:Plasma membrane iron permease [Smittium mucronatum]|uniref:Plasma membrane iron permease n=1 Tax=Smittium mucronatum TaxID=133383 RepID=A0A1R0H6X1_9FUNG|nr:Plasma membrane iron permease [Smittium mucronatum]